MAFLPIASLLWEELMLGSDNSGYKYANVSNFFYKSQTYQKKKYANVSWTVQGHGIGFFWKALH